MKLALVFGLISLILSAQTALADDVYFIKVATCLPTQPIDAPMELTRVELYRSSVVTRGKPIPGLVALGGKSAKEPKKEFGAAMPARLTVETRGTITALTENKLYKLVLVAGNDVDQVKEASLTLLSDGMSSALKCETNPDM